MGTSYRPISLLSVVAKTLEKCLRPKVFNGSEYYIYIIPITLLSSFFYNVNYITANITQTPTQHGYKAQHSTVTALHRLNNRLNNTVAKGFNQMARSPCANYHCSTRYEQSFRHCQHTYLNWKAATDQHPWYDFKVRCELHQGTQSLY